MSAVFGGPQSFIARKPLGDLTSDELITRRSELVASIARKSEKRTRFGATFERQELARLDELAPGLAQQGTASQPGIADQQAALGASGSLGRRATRLGGVSPRGNRLGGSRGNIFKQRLGR